MKSNAEMPLQIFDSITEHIKNRIDTLSAIEGLAENPIGIEGWLKVEILKALENNKNCVIRLSGKGPDLIFEGNKKIELKASSNFNASYIINGLRYECPCLFLIRSRNGDCESIKEEIKKKEIKKKTGKGFSVIKVKRIKKDVSWYIGIIIP